MFCPIHFSCSMTLTNYCIAVPSDIGYNNLQKSSDRNNKVAAPNATHFSSQKKSSLTSFIIILLLHLLQLCCQLRTYSTVFSFKFEKPTITYLLTNTTKMANRWWTYCGVNKLNGQISSSGDQEKETEYWTESQSLLKN